MGEHNADNQPAGFVRLVTSSGSIIEGGFNKDFKREGFSIAYSGKH